MFNEGGGWTATFRTTRGNGPTLDVALAHLWLALNLSAMPDMKLTKEKIDLLVNGTRDERMYACSRSFFLFAIFYFTKYFTFIPAHFHEPFTRTSKAS